MTKQEVENSTYLKNLNPQQTLAVFLSMRADCLVASRRNMEALTALSHAVRVVQHNGGLSGIMEQMALRPMIPDIVLRMKQMHNNPMGDMKPSGNRKNQPHAPHVQLPPEPTPYNPAPFLPKNPQIP